MPVICLGPICIPVYYLWVPLSLLLRPCLRKLYEKCRKPQIHDQNDTSIRERFPGTESLYLNIASVDDWESALKSGIEKEVPIVIDFGADWCNPCKAIKPLFKELSSQFSGVFCVIDIDVMSSIAHWAGVDSVPTFQIRDSKNKEEMFEEVIGADATSLRAMLYKCCRPKSPDLNPKKDD